MVDQIDNAGGNTISPASQIRVWCFTLNNPTLDEIDKIDASFKVNAKKWVFAKEVGASGTPHLQGYVEFNGPKRLAGAKACISERAHVERAKGNAAQNYAYCTKEVFGGQLWEKGFPPARAKVLSPITTPRPFQKKILDMVAQKPDDRKIYWYWDAHGNTGKTALAKHMVLTMRALYVNGKGNDVKYAVSEMFKKQDIDVVVFGFPRTCGPEYVSYGALEEVKDGLVFSPKFESGMCAFNPPHVLVFANFPPDTSKLSMDRWHIEEINPPEPLETTAVPLYDAGWIQGYLATNPVAFPATPHPAAAGAGLPAALQPQLGQGL